MKKGSKVIRTVFTVIGIILCAILIPMLAINITLIIKSTAAKEVPSIGGIVPQIVLTGSMSPEIEAGDLIFCKRADATDVAKGDVISFYDPESKSNAIVTHRVVSVNEDAHGKKTWQTKGDANNAEDATPVPFDNLVAVYRGVRLPGAGNIAMFMQTATGIICCVLIPLILLVGYDVIRRMLYERKSKKDTAALLAELEELRAQKTAQ